MKVINKIYLRSFLLQAVWNYERMQNIGFLFSILPQLKSLYGDNPEKLKESCRRHVGYFNTHPYLAPFIIGFAVKQEEKIKNGEDNGAEELFRNKIQMAGPLAAMGDKMFWSVWRPLIGLTGVLGVLMGIKPYYAVPLIFIMIYNIPVFRHKYKILQAGYMGKARITEGIKKANNSMLFRVLPNIGLLLIVLCVVAAFLRMGMFKGLIFAGVTAVAALLRSYCKLSATKLFYLITALIIFGYLIF